MYMVNDDEIYVNYNIEYIFSTDTCSPSLQNCDFAATIAVLLTDKDPEPEPETLCNALALVKAAGKSGTCYYYY